MFDSTEIKVRAGGGGNGIVSFRREKFVPFGGPDGGDGGRGGDVVLVADNGISSLRLFRQKRRYRAADGKDGGGKRQHGKKGEDLVIMVPVGTVVSNKTQISGSALIADLMQSGQRVVVAQGGRGGLGNVHFASATNQAPRLAQKGEVGEEKPIILELRYIADVGIIGYPNVGKSTLLSAVSAAKPKIAGYPFTTRQPELGVLELESKTVVLAEIPGLLEGAHLGRGLGHDFLRHVGRTQMLIHLIDGSSASPFEDMKRVNVELTLFDSALEEKPQLVAVNKIDLPDVRERLAEIKNTFNQAGITVFLVSAATGEGVAEFMTEVVEMLARVSQERARKTPMQVFRPRPKYINYKVLKEGDTFSVIVPELERLAAGTDIGSTETHRQLKEKLIRLGVGKALERAGIKPGSKVRCGSLEWEWE